MSGVPQRSRTILILLETRHTELDRLLQKHHPPSHHMAVQPTILTPINVPEYTKTKLFDRPNNAKQNMASTKNAFTKHLLNAPAFKIMTATCA
jgi:hypothetical protein